MYRKRFGKPHSKMVTVNTAKVFKVFVAQWGGFSIICNGFIFLIMTMN